MLRTALLALSPLTATVTLLVTATLAGSTVLTVFACGRPGGPDTDEWPGLQQEIRQRFPRAPQIDTETLADWLDHPELAPGGVRPLLLDARTPEEHAVSHLPGARSTPDLATALDVLEEMGRAPSSQAGGEGAAIVVYCSVGWRSSDLVQQLRDRGVDNRWNVGNLWNLEGSIFRWANEGRPVVRNGQPVRQVHPFDDRWGRFLETELWAYEASP